MYMHIHVWMLTALTRPGDCKPMNAQVPRYSMFDQVGLTVEGSCLVLREVNSVPL